MKFSMSKTIGIGLAAATLLAGCGGGGGGGGRSILMQGGTGEYGGTGGYAYADVYTGGNLEVRRGGTVDTHFDLPKNITPYLGSNPRTISGTVELTVADDFVDGVINSTELIGDDGDNAATGLWIKKGAVVTLDGNCGNWDCSGGTIGYRAVLNFSDGVLIEGSLILAGQDDVTLGDTALDEPVALRWDNYPANLVITKDGSVNGNAKAACTNAARYIHLYADGSVVNQGTVSGVGSDCTDGNGGNGSDIILKSDSASVFNTGDLTSSGGSSTSDNGGDAGDIDIEAYGSLGNALNSGKLTGIGGTGKTGGGSGSSYIYIYNDSVGDVISGGDIDCHGGDGTSATDDANGGDGCYYIGIYGYSGNVLVSGKINAKGGNGAGDGDGGDSATDEVNIAGYQDSEVDTTYLGGRVWISADMDLRGGDGGDGTDAYGGTAGYVYNDTDYDDYARPFDGSSVKYLGYDTWNWSGGDGRSDGETPYDDSTFYNNYTLDSDGTYWMGAFITETDFIGNGGNGTDGDGADAYYFEIDNDYDVPAILNTKITGDVEYVLNTGKISLKGGSGKTDAGAGGDFYATDNFKTTNHGTVDTSGGSCTGSSNCSGGAAGYIEWYSDRDLENTADLTANGGAGTGTGTGGGTDGIYLDAVRTKTSGNLSNNGGSATGSDLGADGGYIEITSVGLKASESSGNASVTAGTNAPVEANGDTHNGDVVVDGVNIVSSTGTAKL